MTYIKANGNQMESMNPLEVHKSAKLGNQIAAKLAERGLQPDALVRFPVAVKSALISKGEEFAGRLVNKTGCHVNYNIMSLIGDRLDYVTSPKKEEMPANDLS